MDNERNNNWNYNRYKTRKSLGSFNRFWELSNLESLYSEDFRRTKSRITIRCFYPFVRRKWNDFSTHFIKVWKNREFRWVGKLLVKGIFDGEHYFVLSQELGNKTKFTHGEKFRGILIYFAGKILDKTKGGFELMNESLKIECEK